VPDQPKSQSPDEVLWELADAWRSRGVPRSPGEFTAFQAEAERRGANLSFRQLLEFFARGHLGSAEGLAPAAFSHFAVAYLAAERRPQRLLDPWAGNGVLVSEVADALEPDEAVAITPNQTWLEVAKALGSARVEWLLGDAFQHLPQLQTVDTVVSAPPFGLQRDRRRFALGESEVELSDNRERLVMLEAAVHLGGGGVAIYLVPDGFFFQRQSLWHRLGEFGLNARAVIALPPRSLAPLTSVAASALVIDRQPHEQLFIGQIEEENLGELMANLRRGHEGDRPELGRLVEHDEFRGFSAYSEEERVERWAREAGLRRHTLGEIGRIVHFDRLLDGFSEGDNAVFVSMVGVPRVAAATDVHALRTSANNCFQLVLDPQVALAEYVSNFFNSERGRALRRAWSGGTTIQRIPKPGLETRAVYLPDIDRQAEMVRLSDAARSTRARLGQLEADLWETPQDISFVRDEIVGLIADDDRWIEELPFPLASILTRYRAARLARDKSEHLMHFFEALASFTATLLLSTFYWDADTFETYRPRWREIRGLRKATFGGWVTLHSEIGKTVRELLLTADGERLALELFRTARLRLVEALVEPAVDDLYRVTLQRRNVGPGHGGIASEEEFERRLELLEGDLSRFRELFGGAFLGYRLIRAGSARKRPDVVHQSAQSLMGSSQTFAEIEVEALELIDDAAVYLLDPETRRPLPLVPFIQIRPGPKTAANACYFYNAIEENRQVRLVSYHFEQEASIEAVEPQLVALVESLATRRSI
jgi:hypothetical protein